MFVKQERLECFHPVTLQGTIHPEEQEQRDSLGTSGAHLLKLRLTYMGVCHNFFSKLLKQIKLSTQ